MADSIAINIPEILKNGIKGRARHSDVLNELSVKNIDIVDQLIQEARRQNKLKRKKDANKLLDIVGEILENNKELQKLVGELRSEGS